MDVVKRIKTTINKISQRDHNNDIIIIGSAVVVMMLQVYLRVSSGKSKIIISFSRS